MSATSITPFAFGENLVRVIADENGDPWFVAKDVALALDYEWKASGTIGHVPEEWRGVYSVRTPSGAQVMLTLSEQGLYFFLGRSDKPGALPFQKWMAGEVMPSIRKTGSYTAPHAAQLRRAALPADLPAEALALRPAMRQRLWRDALDTARLDNSGLDVAMEWFGKLCCLVAASPPEPDSRSQKVRDFFAACCVAAPGHSVRATMLYEAMRRWHRAKPGEMPSMRIFGEVMGYLAPRTHSNGSLYRDIALKNA